MEKRSHQVRIRIETYRLAEEAAKELSKQSGRDIKSSDIIDAAVKENAKSLTIKKLIEQKTIVG